MYPFLGDDNDYGQPDLHIELMLCKDKSEIGKCLQELYFALKHWGLRGGGKYAIILDALDVDIYSESYLRWSRAQTFRIACAIARMIEARMASWPMKLFGAVHESFTDEEQVVVAREWELSHVQMCVDRMLFRVVHSACCVRARPHITLESKLNKLPTREAR